MIPGGEIGSFLGRRAPWTSVFAAADADTNGRNVAFSNSRASLSTAHGPICAVFEEEDARKRKQCVFKQKRGLEVEFEGKAKTSMAPAS